VKEGAAWREVALQRREGGDTTERGTREGGARESGRCSAEATKMSIRHCRENRELGKIASIRCASGIELFDPLCRLFSTEATYNLSQTGPKWCVAVAFLMMC
jgi:hypothetical protein